MHPQVATGEPFIDNHRYAAPLMIDPDEVRAYLRDQSRGNCQIVRAPLLN